MIYFSLPLWRQPWTPNPHYTHQHDHKPPMDPIPWTAGSTMNANPFINSFVSPSSMTHLLPLVSAKLIVKSCAIKSELFCPRGEGNFVRPFATPWKHYGMLFFLKTTPSCLTSIPSPCSPTQPLSMTFLDNLLFASPPYATSFLRGTLGELSELWN